MPTMNFPADYTSPCTPSKLVRLSELLAFASGIISKNKLVHGATGFDENGCYTLANFLHSFKALACFKNNGNFPIVIDMYDAFDRMTDMKEVIFELLEGDLDPEDVFVLKPFAEDVRTVLLNGGWSVVIRRCEGKPDRLLVYLPYDPKKGDQPGVPFSSLKKFKL